MGKRRIRNLQYLKAGDIVGYDPREDRRHEVSERYRVKVVADFADGMTMAPDALIISTPPDLHMSYAVIAVQHGKHFFTEASVIDAGMDEIIALCNGKGIVAAPSCTMRFQPSIRVIRDLVASEAIGPILGFTYHSGQYLPDWHPWEDYKSFYVAKRETGGCREIVPFELVWLTWVLGKVIGVSCFRQKAMKLDVDIDDIYQILLRFSQGTFGHMLVDVISRVPYRSCRFLSEEGVIDWVWSNRCVRVFKAADTAWKEYFEPEGVAEEGYIHAENMYIEEMRAFIEAVRGKTEYPYTFQEDKEILAILNAAEESAEKGVHIDLSARAKVKVVA
jgi:predicted dehydrogenase